jgi:acetyl-CoA synthetase
MTWDPPWVRWFDGGQLNASYNCLDRHVEAGGGDKVAYYWEGEPGEERAITYRELLDEVGRFANALKELGVRKGDRVAIYLGMIPELPVAMLACARTARRTRRCSVASADCVARPSTTPRPGSFTRWRVPARPLVALKDNADEALKDIRASSTRTVRRTGGEHRSSRGATMVPRAIAQPAECPPEPIT